MRTVKEYGLIFEDLSVKVVEVTVNQPTFANANDLEKELNLFLSQNNIKPIAIIPDTAFYRGTLSETKIREATKREAKEYIFQYQEDDFDRYKCQ